MKNELLLSGSEWRQWDLHAHSPLSFEWRGSRLDLNAGETEQNTVLAGVVAAIENAAPAVFCILDYWTFDGYIALRRYIQRHVPGFAKTVLPGIELRVEAPTDFRLNTQVLFDDALSDDRLREFVGRLSIPMTAKASDSRPPSKATFIEYARDLDSAKLKKHGFSDADRSSPDRMLLAGMQVARITRTSLEEAVKAFRGSCVVVLPWDTNDGLSKLDWERHSHEATRLLRSADALETRNAQTIDTCLGRETKRNSRYIEAFTEALGPKRKCAPLCGSDAHQTSDYGVFPNDRKLWIKADPTFAGLQQAIREPETRTFIGVEPPKLEHVRNNATRYLKHIAIGRRAGSALAETWFDSKIPLNPGLIAIIGNKGSGKSALADIIALLANAHCSDMSFLNEERFCKPREGKGSAFEATLTFASGKMQTRILDETFDAAAPEACRYLTQGYLEDLCNKIHDDGATAFERELKKVIFSHADPKERERFQSLDDAVAYRTEGSKSLLSTHRDRLEKVNEELVALEALATDETKHKYEKRLDLRKSELAAHLAAKPALVPLPTDEASDTTAADRLTETQAALQKLELEIAERRDVILAAKQRVAVVSRLEGRLAAFGQQFDSLLKNSAKDLEELGLVATQLVAVEIHSGPLLAAREAAELAIQGATAALDPVGSLIEAQKSTSNSVLEQQLAMTAPYRAHQEYMVKLAGWEARRAEIVGRADVPESIQGLEDRIRYVTEVVPAEVAEKRAERKAVMASIYDELAKVRTAYETMYAPAQSFAREHPVARQELDLEFRVAMRADGFADRFLDHINQARRGGFQGAEEGKQKLAKMLAEAEFDTWQGVEDFIVSLERALSPEGDAAATDIRSQLRRGYDVMDLYRHVYGLEWLDVRYGLSMRGKNLASLSPGERGAVLLLFYLLLDKDGHPIIIDQPEQNLDNESVYRVLVPCIREVRERRQVILVTHNPNLAIVCDAEQIIAASLAKEANCAVTYVSGSIENFDLNARALDVLEGSWPAFENRREKYRQPNT